MIDELVENDGRWTPWAVGALRIVTALLFLEHGTSKILFFPETAGSGPSMWSLLWVAGWIELIGSLLLLVGLFTRPVAFLLAGEMAIAYWTVHSPKAPYPVLNGGEAAILFCFIFLLLLATGSGAWSVDGVLRRRRPEADGYRA
ncbi:DoxX family protein [Sphingomonas sp.]|uniref:DoxX family protein n=1 Tax=Sphingomonas sp. TaxID=28214 RepID=UPI00286D0154|nr:DoxX family protein [Sphingomonas sp.]